MSYNPTAPRYLGINCASTQTKPSMKHHLWLTFISGPRVLLTSQISVKCALSMIVMCMPALIFTALLTLPALIFESPQQHAYFYFSRVLDQDPTRWFVLFLASLCVILSLSLPATMKRPPYMDDY
jgi:hypothetical protein